MKPHMTRLIAGQWLNCAGHMTRVGVSGSHVAELPSQLVALWQEESRETGVRFHYIEWWQNDVCTQFFGARRWWNRDNDEIEIVFGSASSDWLPCDPCLSVILQRVQWEFLVICGGLRDDSRVQAPTLARHHAKQNVVFAVAARTAARNFEPLAALLAQAAYFFSLPGGTKQRRVRHHE